MLGDIVRGKVGIHLCDHGNALIAHENPEGWSCLSSSRMSGLIIDTSKVYRYSVPESGRSQCMQNLKPVDASHKDASGSGDVQQ